MEVSVKNMVEGTLEQISNCCAWICGVRECDVNSLVDRRIGRQFQARP